MLARTRHISFFLLLAALVAALVGSSPAGAAIEPPWCGTPEPDAAAALPSTGTSFPHIPVYAIGCTLEDIKARSLDDRMSIEIAGHSATGRPMYKVVINQLKTGTQKQAYFRWTNLRQKARTDPASVQAQLRTWGDDVKVPLYIQGSIHGNEYEGVDSNMRVIERLATTPYGTDDEVDAILDGAVVIFNVIQNPDGRVVGTRANSNGFDLNRDFLTQSQPETKVSVGIMQEWLPPETLDLHGYVTPTLIEATTKPHNPGIDYDLWLKWNQGRIDANEAAMNAVNMGVTRPINDWCSDGSISVQGGPCPDGQPAGPAVAESWDDWGPFYTPMYSQLVGLNGSTVEGCQSTSTSTNPLNRCYLNADPDPAKNPVGRNAALLAHVTTTWSTLLYDSANRNELLYDQMEIYRRGVAGEARPACCPAPFDVENNWMHEFPTAYVIPMGAGQRSDAEANRLVSVAARQRHRGDEAALERSRPGPGRRAGLVRRPHGPGAPWPGRDVARHRRRHLEPDRHPLRAAGGVEPRLPLGRRHPAGAERRGLHGRDDGADREADDPRRRHRDGQRRVLRARDELGDRGADAQRGAEERPDREAGEGAVHTGRRAHVPGRHGALPVRPRDEAGDRRRGPRRGAAAPARPLDGAPARGHRPLAADRGVHERGRPERLVAPEPRLHRRPGRDDGAERCIGSARELRRDLQHRELPGEHGRERDRTGTAGGVLRRRRRLHRRWRERRGFVTNGGLQTGLATGNRGGNGRSGIVYWNNTGGATSLITGAYPAQDTAIMDPPTWLTTVPAGWSIDANLPVAGFFAAGLWLIDAASAGAPGAPLVTHGLSTAGASRLTVFAFNPLYRADPEREWPALASAALWADQ